jgi:Tfp pilus assembly protein PilX
MKYANTFHTMPCRQTGAALAISLTLLAVATLVGVVAMQSTTQEEKMAGNLRDANLAFQAADSALLAGENILRNYYWRWVGEFLQDRNLDGVQDGGLPFSWVVVPPGANFSQSCPPPPPQQYGGDASPCNLPFPLPPTGWYAFPQNVQQLNVTPQGWAWVLDENDLNFPLGPRLDPNPGNFVPGSNAVQSYWWDEQGVNWWATNQSQSFQLPPNSLDTVANQPRFVIEYLDFPGNDPLNRDEGIAAMRAADGVVIQNEKPFRRERHYYRITARGEGGVPQDPNNPDPNPTVVMLQSNFFWIYHLPTL